MKPQEPQTKHMAEQRCDFTSGFSQCPNTLPFRETVKSKIGFYFCFGGVILLPHLWSAPPCSCLSTRDKRREGPVARR